MVIQEINAKEMEEVIVLANKGWEGCNEEEKKRWAELVAKAKLATSRRAVVSTIELAKYMIGER